ncbi:glucose-6-phosphate dehydrogenase [Echinimonas agarilytica]|uniref:Glucose-6-phosphate 1-dehydrogenase n=1 Tax=Echinimonas agarilytica TaxID=1215918 RepID=A0AA42B729_9GAMM|nr:glucose-6-phosphate dehydrogenase [Echinimonas agarilytica]MCM2679462.1 glucose-6-phosphate dehydrogenase [Echinimonas agarilytica]
MSHGEHAAHCDFVLIGAQGDLARRKLLPSLYELDKAGLLHEDTRIVGAARRDYSHEEYRQVVLENTNTFKKEDLCEETWARFVKRLYFFRLDVAEQASYDAIREFLGEAVLPSVFYFAMPPATYGTICQGLNTAGLVDDKCRVVLEKPIGKDLESSKVINDQVAEFFKESQIYRIDHYLGKETVMNMFALRFANALFTNNWDHNTIDHVQITVGEEVGIEGRWGYFDQAGQMRDMVQNHLLQLLTIMAMEPPADLSADSVRTEKLKVLKALRPISHTNIDAKTVRGQYAAGFLKGQSVPGYLEEDGANERSETETFVAIRVDIDNWRWAGVPFYLRTGKRMPQKLSEIVVYFKQQPHNVFEHSYRNLPANKLIIRLQPNEGVELQVLNKVPGLDEPMKLQETKLDLSFSETFASERIADAYERLLYEAMVGNQTLFVSRNEVEEAWIWADSIIEAWQHCGVRAKPYQAGTWGPVSSVALLAKDDRNWHE